MQLSHLSHGVRHCRGLGRQRLQLPPERNGVTGHARSTTTSPSPSSGVYIGTAPHDGRPDPVGDPGPGPAQGHGAFGQGGVQPAAQAPGNADRVIGDVVEVQMTGIGVSSVERLNILHGQGLARAGEAAGGTAAAVAPVSEARGAREAWGATGTTGHGPVPV